MFLVRHAREVMDPDVLVLPAEYSFDAFLREHEAKNGCATSW
jgi:CIC family chloride channel protein